jgi:hypothetical protein
VLALYGIGKISSDSAALSLDVYIKKLRLYLFNEEDQVLKPDELATSYYIFQSGNRCIGEYLFKITGMMVIVWVASSFISFAFGLILPEFMELSTSWSALCFTLCIFSMTIFILPQVGIHIRLKRYKRKIVDLLNIKIEQIYDIYIKSFYYKDIIPIIDKDWKYRRDLNDEVKIIKKFIERTESFSTWSSDFPEILKVVFVSLTTLVPFVYKFFFPG